MSDEFTFKTAVRSRVSLIIGLAAGTGGGKTRTAMELARGLCGGDDSKIKFVDTESGRALMYATGPGEKPTADLFAFKHCELHAPFTPERYTGAIVAADTPDTEVIIVDSFSHVWDGEGGLQDMHLEMVERDIEKARAYAEKDGKPFDEMKAREKASMGAWKEPKSRHRRMVSRLLQCRSHIIICLRADEKLRMETIEETGSGGRKYKRTVITQAKDLPIGERWVPVCEKRFPFELALSILLTRDQPGVPIPINIRGPHIALIPLDQQINADTGRRLAQWARGGATSIPKEEPVVIDPAVIAAGDKASKEGIEALQSFWTAMPASKQKTALASKLTEWKAIAEKVVKQKDAEIEGGKLF